MTAFLSYLDARIMVWSLRICGIAGLIMALVLVCFAIQEAGAVELMTVTGNSSGNGTHITEVDGISLENLTFEEALLVLGPAHNFNVSRDGLLTFKNGSTWQICGGLA